MRILLTILIVTSICGCVSTEMYAAPKYTAQSMKAVGTFDLCDDYYRSRNPAVIDELVSRHVLDAQGVRVLQNRRAEIGMNSVPMACLYGPPVTTNITETAGGKQSQYVFCRNYMASWKIRELDKPGILNPAGGANCGGFAYIYLENGVVTALQNIPTLNY